MNYLSNIAEIIVNPSTKLSEILKKLQNTQHKIIIVADDNCLKGTITDGDCRRALLNGEGLDCEASKIMNSGCIFIEESLDYKNALALANSYNVNHIPVVSNVRKEVIGLFSKVKDDSVNTLPVTALILAGGEGKRLRPLTATTPKPMLPVGNKPILEHLVSQLVISGIKDIYISVGYLSEQIISYFGNGEKFNCKINYVIESEPKGTAGPLAYLPKDIQKNLLVMNGDLITSVNLGQLFQFHKTEKNQLTVAVANHQVEIPFGVVNFNPAGSIKSVKEKPTKNYYINAGIYLLDSKLCRNIPKDTFFTMMDFIEDLLYANTSIGAFPIHENWIDVGLPKQYYKALNMTQILNNQVEKEYSENSLDYSVRN